MLNVFHIFLTLATFIYHFTFFVAMFTIIIPDSQKSAPQIIILLDQNQVHANFTIQLIQNESKLHEKSLKNGQKVF